jgi:hypothetical protein
MDLYFKYIKYNPAKLNKGPEGDCRRSGKSSLHTSERMEKIE